MRDPEFTIKSKRLNLTNRSTTLWGFNEAAFGGILHLFRFPLRGMFISANAVFLISLITYFSKRKEELLKSTIMVLLVKAFISPYTPLNAYFAVAFQGVTGYVFYRFIPWRKYALLLHSVVSQIQSSLQRFITLTIFFGMTFWESFNIYVEYVLGKVGIESTSGSGINYSLIIITAYVIIHIIAGIYVFFIGWKSPDKIKNRIRARRNYRNSTHTYSNGFDSKGNKKKKRFWWQRKSGIVLLVLFAVMMLLPFIDPSLEKGNTFNIIYMLCRAVVITFLWFFFISPLIVKILRSFLKKKETIYANELNDILEVIPHMKQETKRLWNERKMKGTKGLKDFTLELFYTLLFAE